MSNTCVAKPYLSILQEFGAFQFPHSTRHLSDHLIGTYRLLQAWETPEDVCLAGLFHSIYGTKYYQNQELHIGNREKVRQLIGVEAEFLVYLFCVTDRREFFVNLGCDSPILRNIRDHSTCSVGQKVLTRLITMEVANWVEIFPFIGSQLTPISIDRTLELFETASSLLPNRANEDLQTIARQLA